MMSGGPPKLKASTQSAEFFVQLMKFLTKISLKKIELFPDVPGGV